MGGAAMIVTPLYAAVLVALFLLLALRGAQSNFTDYVLLALVLLLILELSHFSLYLIHALGIVLVLARLLHGYALAFSDRSPFARSAGTGLTVAVLVVEALLCLYQAYRGHVVWFTT